MHLSLSLPSHLSSLTIPKQKKQKQKKNNRNKSQKLIAIRVSVLF